MSDKNKVNTDFVEMKTNDQQKITITKINNRPNIILLSIALTLSLFINMVIFTQPEMICIENSKCTDELDGCLVALESSDDRIMNCLLQRAQEMSLREEAVGDCIVELKATEIELELYKKDVEKKPL